MADNLHTNEEARIKLVAGVDKVANAVKGTLGAAGYNGLLEAFESPGHIVTNDGISIAQSIRLEDPVENIGANLMKEIGRRSDKQSGDGTTTSITLAQAIIHGGLKETVPPMQLKRSLEDCLPIIEASIKDQTKEITVDDVGVVASISAEDPAIGALIQEVYQKIGKDGILYPDVSKTFSDHYTLGTGVHIEGAGFASPYMADTDESGRWLSAASYKNARILVTKQKITSARDVLDTVGAALFGAGIKELVIFCDEFEAPVIPDLVMTRAAKGFKTLLVKLPVLWKDQWFEDIGKMTGATVIGDGLLLKNAKIEHLGTIGSIVVDKTDTYLDGIQDISEWIATILESDTDDDKIRAARLNTKTARLFVGAPTDAALSYKRLKVEDARNAAWQALHGGIVPGGGVCLHNAADSMPDTVGGRILRVALKYPLVQIMRNGGLEASVFHNANDHMLGIDARSGEVVNMFDAGIVDAANTVRNAVRNAISVAATVLTAKVVVTLDKTQPQGL